jgi:branched-chain amino acid transport system substrate-binding protein
MKTASVSRAKKRTTRSLAAVCAALALTACGNGSGGSSDTIKLGGLFTLSPQPFGNDAQKMVKAVFDEANAAGGINGKKIRYMSADDTANPTKAAQVAREFVGDGAVGMVGSVSFVDCGTNHSFYEQNDILSITGIGADPFCFTTPNIAPVNIGPFTSITADLYYASQVLKDRKICVFMAATPGTKQAQAAAVQRWTRLTGNRPVVFDAGLPLTVTDFTPYLLRAKSAGCDAVFRNGADVVGNSVLKIAKNQGMQGVDFLFDASSYTAQLARAASPLGMKVYLASEFEPFTANSPANADWRKLAQQRRINQTAFAQGAYVAAKWMIEVLKSIKGPVTRAAVTKALRAGGAFHQDMAGSPLVFGTAKAHAPNQAFKIVTIKNGTWQTETQDFITLK